MTTKDYAQALYALFQESPRATLGKDFVDYLKKNGKFALLPGILRALEKIEAEKLRSTTCEVTVAHQEDLEGAVRHAQAFIKEHGGEVDGWKFEERVDPSLIGGYRIRTPERELDMSDKRGLYRLYETLRSAS